MSKNNLLLEKDKKKKKIVETLGKGKNKYYVYLLCDKNNVFYVGKGEGKRLWDHQNALEIKKGKINDFFKEEKKRICKENNIEESEIQNAKQYSKKIERIKKSIKNKKFEKRIVKYGLSEKEAFAVESALINYFGMENLTNIVNGHATKKEIEIYGRSKMFNVEKFPVYREKQFSGIKNALLLNIRKLYFKAGCEDVEGDIKKYKEKLYKCAGMAWGLAQKWKNKHRIEKIYVMNGSICLGVINNPKFSQLKDLTDKNIQDIKDLNIETVEFRNEEIRLIEKYIKCKGNSYDKKIKEWERKNKEIEWIGLTKITEKDRESKLKTYFNKWYFTCKTKDIVICDKFFIMNGKEKFSFGQRSFRYSEK